MKLIIASNNAHKVSEIKAILGCFYDEILSLREAGIDMDVVEDAEHLRGQCSQEGQRGVCRCRCGCSTVGRQRPDG